MKPGGKPYGASASSDLVEFLSLAKRESGAAEAMQNCLQNGLPIIVVDDDCISAGGAIDCLVCFQLNETLMEYLLAFQTL